MNAQLTIDQILAINTFVADYIIQPPALTNDDQFYDVILSADMPEHKRLQLGSICRDLRLFATFTPYKSGNSIHLWFAVWSYDYKPRYSPA